MEIRADIAELMSKCTGCGACEDVCTSRPYSGCSPLEVMGGKLEMARGCLGCGLCNKVCDYTIPKKVMMYAVCAIGGLKPPQVFFDTGYNLPKSEMEGVPVPDYAEGAEAQLMPGCMVNTFAPYLEYATEKALRITGVRTERYEGGCCTYPVFYRGMTDEERDSVKKERASSLGGRKLYTICSGCRDEMVASGFDSEHVFRRLHENLDVLRGLPGTGLRVAVIPGCGLRDNADAFREIAEACGCEVADVPQGCCGKMVPGVSERLMAERQKDLEGVDAVVVGCPSCFGRYDQYPDGVPVLHISEVVCLAAGDHASTALHRHPL